MTELFVHNLGRVAAPVLVAWGICWALGRFLEWRGR